MIQSTGGEWTLEDLDATGRLYQLRSIQRLTDPTAVQLTPELRSGAARSVLTEWNLPPLDL